MTGWQAEIGMVSRPHLFGSEIGPQRYVEFRKNNVVVQFSCNDRLISRLSDNIPPTLKTVDRFLGFEGRLTSPNDQFSIRHFMHLIKGGDNYDVDTEVVGAINEFFFSNSCYGIGGTMGHCLLFDRPFAEVRRWFQQFEVEASSFYTNIKFINQIGYCQDCHCELTLEQHGVGKWGWGLYLCAACTEIRIENERQRRFRRGKEFVLVDCHSGCGRSKWVDRLVIDEGQTRHFCNRTCLQEWLAKVNAQKYERAEFYCNFCGRSFTRLTSRTKKFRLHFCTELCRRMKQGLILADRTIYTPPILQSLLDYEGEVCAWPSCLNRRAKPGKTNPWNCCYEHATKIYSALRARAKVRRLGLVKTGL